MLAYLAHLILILRLARRIIEFSLKWGLDINRCSIRFSLGLRLARRIVESSLRWSLGVTQCCVRFNLDCRVGQSA